MKWRTTIIGAVTIPVLISMIACGGKSELSRGKATKVIQASDKFTPGNQDAHLKADTVRVGLEQGFWQKGPENPHLFTDRTAANPDGKVYTIILTPKGSTYFSSIGGFIYPGQPLGEAFLQTKTMPRRVVEVTGIADGPEIEGPQGTTKDVQFTWKWDLDSVPKEVKALLETGPKASKGEALMKLYDDGWRVEEVKLD
jgi:hypothetical protein